MRQVELPKQVLATRLGLMERQPESRQMSPVAWWLHQSLLECWRRGCSHRADPQPRRKRLPFRQHLQLMK